MNTDDDIIELAKRYRNEIENSEASGMAKFVVDDVHRLAATLLAVYAEVPELRDRNHELRSRLRRACELLRSITIWWDDKKERTAWKGEIDAFLREVEA